ncbi:tyrosine-type recombinase/integrase [Clostridium sp. cel8]|uniref:tyrosine-type recombinase/integrase n=1 Tax=Clostridium sp. cel8 TaxID=2663123 RepID=UPI0015F65887|nr:tyrosine-type recombinase/integrase [Clostridium sp. cel8]MBA5850265.1 tyrosine-type recombinase/integrase [Clostridium sp. cel8]
MDTTIKYFTQDELKRLFKTIQKSNDRHALRNLCIFRVAYRCGLRASEVGLLKLEYYNKLKGELYCKRLKGSWNNTIALDKETTKVLNRYIKEYGIKEEAELLFKSQEQKPISRKTLDYLIKRYCKIAKIKDKSKWHFHCLKHSIAVHLAESDLDIKEVKFWLSHKSVNSTLCYFQFTSSQQKTMLEKLERHNMLV